MITAQMEQEVSGEFADLLHRHTDGNPLFIQETLRALIERGEIYRQETLTHIPCNLPASPLIPYCTLPRLT
jgi:predicted ATPase